MFKTLKHVHLCDGGGGIELFDSFIHSLLICVVYIVLNLT